MIFTVLAAIATIATIQESRPASRPVGFESAILVPPSQPSGKVLMRVADLDGDGKLEIILADSGSTSYTVKHGGGSGIRIFTNKGLLLHKIPTGDEFVADIQCADLDGNGKKEILTYCDALFGILRAYDADGTRRFETRDAVIASSDAEICVSTRNGTREIYLFLANFFQDGIFTKEGKHRLWVPLVPYQVRGGTGFSIGDFDKDGKPYLITDTAVYKFHKPLPDGESDNSSERTTLCACACLYSESKNSDPIIVFGDHRGIITFLDLEGRKSPFQQANDRPCWIGAADLDGDGRKEVYVKTTQGGLFAWTREGKPVLSIQTTPILSLWNSTTLAADLDGDGRAEIAFSERDTDTRERLVIVDSTGRRLASFPMETPISELQIADLDGDGRLEVITCQTNGRVDVFRYTKPPAANSRPAGK
ncbi:MAG: hypothetical protein HY286_13520 [Planctomycetes bacterium]|nr:hypothetical protein [Planctomycetota bacterium]